MVQFDFSGNDRWAFTVLKVGDFVTTRFNTVKLGENDRGPHLVYTTITLYLERPYSKDLDWIET